jgi:hypothetical protein
VNTGKELKENATRKIKLVKRLIVQKECELAAYLMGEVLECALKAASCRTLKLNKYPPFTIANKLAEGFKTHDFEQLLIVSGLTDIFGYTNQNWSNFTYSYPGSWTEMRYSDMSQKFSAEKVRELADNLYGSTDSIITVITKRRRW